MSQTRSQDALVEQIERSWNLIRGRMLGFLESLGLSATQEAGAKSTFRALASDAQDRLVALVNDGALEQALTAVGEGIAELQRLEREIESEAALEDSADDREHLRFALRLVEQRLGELRDRKRDLGHLAKIQAELGGAR